MNTIFANGGGGRFPERSSYTRGIVASRAWLVVRLLINTRGIQGNVVNDDDGRVSSKVQRNQVNSRFRQAWRSFNGDGGAQRGAYFNTLNRIS